MILSAGNPPEAVATFERIDVFLGIVARATDNNNQSPPIILVCRRRGSLVGS